MSFIRELLTLLSVAVPAAVITRDAIAPTPADMAGEVFEELWPYCAIVVAVAVAVVIVVRRVKKKKRAALAAQEKPENKGEQ